MFPYLHLGPLAIQTPLLALLAGLWVGLSLVDREAGRQNLSQAVIGNLVFYSFAAGIIGARLGYALQFPALYASKPLSLLALTPTALDPFAGFAAGLVAFGIIVQRKAVPLRPTLDALAPGLAIMMVAVGLSHILSGDAYGAPTKVPWAIHLWNDNRHPTQFYETFIALIVFLVIRQRLPKPEGAGLNFLLTIALTAGSRVFLEAFRGDSIFWPGGLRQAQVLALAVMAAGLYAMRKWMNEAARADEQAKSA